MTMRMRWVSAVGGHVLKDDAGGWQTILQQRRRGLLEGASRVVDKEGLGL
jgi:hypothetical protein